MEDSKSQGSTVILKEGMDDFLNSDDLKEVIRVLEKLMGESDEQ